MSTKNIKSEIKTNTNTNINKEATEMKTIDFKTQMTKCNGSAEGALNRVESCVAKLISEMDEHCSHLDYLDTASIPNDFLYEVLNHGSDFQYSFEDFILYGGMLPFYWKEDALQAYAEEVGLNEEETALFVNSFTENNEIAMRFENLVEEVFNAVQRWAV